MWHSSVPVGSKLGSLVPSHGRLLQQPPGAGLLRPSGLVLQGEQPVPIAVPGAAKHCCHCFN